MILSVSGFIGSGKDTIADYLCAHHGFKRLSFAASVKDAIAIIFGWDRSLLEGDTKSSREWRETVDSWWSARLNIPDLTPRYVLQIWGTDVCRNHFHDEIWIASLENKLRSLSDNIVITDCRFLNEMTAIKKAKGVTIRVTRGPNPIWYNDALIVNQGSAHPDYHSSKLILSNYGIHSSEYSSVGLPYDYVIDNNGTLSVLHSKIRSVINL